VRQYGPPTANARPGGRIIFDFWRCDYSFFSNRLQAKPLRLTANAPFAFGGVISPLFKNFYMQKMASTANILRIAISRKKRRWRSA
jgi:hypothetical protein